MSHERHEQEKRAEREHEKAAGKHHEREVEAQGKKGLRSPRPFWLMVIGIILTLFIVYLWTVYVSPRAG